MRLKRKPNLIDTHLDPLNSPILLSDPSSFTNRFEFSAYPSTVNEINAFRANLIIENPEIDYSSIPLPTAATGGSLSFQVSKGTQTEWEFIIDPADDQPIEIDLHQPKSFIVETYFDSLRVVSDSVDGVFSTYIIQAW